MSRERAPPGGEHDRDHDHTREEEKRMMVEKKREEQDWREVPRAEMFERVIIAVDCARGDAEAHGDIGWMRYCDDTLFPFLEAEQERARAAA
jgi:hypothetical protein